jgi:hypothetical protein
MQHPQLPIRQSEGKQQVPRLAILESDVTGRNVHHTIDNDRAKSRQA